MHVGYTSGTNWNFIEFLLFLYDDENRYFFSLADLRSLQAAGAFEALRQRGYYVCVIIVMKMIEMRINAHVHQLKKCIVANYISLLRTGPSKSKVHPVRRRDGAPNKAQRI